MKGLFSIRLICGPQNHTIFVGEEGDEDLSLRGCAGGGGTFYFLIKNTNVFIGRLITLKSSQ